MTLFEREQFPRFHIGESLIPETYWVLKRLKMLDKMKASLGERVKDVKVTLRLTDSPACLVADEHDLGMNLARILKAAGQNAPVSKPILEINPKHPAVLRLVKRVVDAGHKAGIPVAMCGEMAGDLTLTKLLLGLGLRSFSMHPAQILAVKQEILRSDTTKLAPWARRVMEAEDPERELADS